MVVLDLLRLSVQHLERFASIIFPPSREHPVHAIDCSALGSMVRLPINERLQKVGGGDFPRAVAESVRQLFIKTDVEGLIGGGRHECDTDQLNRRNGPLDRALDTRMSDLKVKIRTCGRLVPVVPSRRTSIGR